MSKVSFTTLLFFGAAMAVLGFADFSIKRSSGRINPALGTLIYAVAAILPPLAWTIWTRAHEPLRVTRGGVLWAVATGLAFGTFTGILFLLFSRGVNLSVGSPIVRVGGMAFAASLGIILLREPFNLQYLIGVVLAALGILLIATR